MHGVAAAAAGCVLSVSASAGGCPLVTEDYGADPVVGGGRGVAGSEGVGAGPGDEATGMESGQQKVHHEGEGDDPKGQTHPTSPAPG